MIYNEEFETLPREALRALQVKRLQQVLERVYPVSYTHLTLPTKRIV